MRKRYYLPFIPAAKVNYLYLFALSDLAEYNTTAQVFDTINYSSVKELSDRLNLSPSATTNLLKNENYAEYFSVDKKNRQIILKSFKSVKTEPFVSFTSFEVSMMKQ